jgi:hypothetical protein
METTKPGIEDMNKTIAEFMGYERYEDSYGIWFKKDGLIISMHPKLEDLKYHSSWDWLISSYVEFRNRMGGDISFDDNDQLNIKFTIALKYGNIERCHQAVYEMIEWYNKHTSQL